MTATPLPGTQDPDPHVPDDVFARAWQYVGHRRAVAAPGSSFPARVGPLPVMVTCDEDRALRALVAVCRHQGAVIRQPAGPTSTVRCAYHGWVYGLDGALQAAPGADAGFDPAAHSLPELPVATWGPFVFAAAHPDVPPLAEVLRDVPDRLMAGGIDVDRLQWRHRTRWRVAANWKLCVAARIATRGGQAAGQFHLIYPATTIDVLPGHPNLTIGPLLPAGAGATEGFLDQFFAPGADPEWIADPLVAELDGWLRGRLDDGR